MAIATLVVVGFQGCSGGGRDEAEEQKQAGDAEGSGWAVNLQLLEPDNVFNAAMNFDAKAFAKMAKPVLDAAERVEVNIGAADQYISLRIGMHPAGDHDVEVFARPGLDPDRQRALAEKLRAIAGLRTVHFPARFQVNLERGKPPEPEEGDAWVASGVPRFELRSRAFDAADTTGKVALIRSLASDYALPLLGAYQRLADPSFAGVVGLGEMFEGLDFSKPLDVRELIDENDLYWRAMAEMALGNPTVIATRIFAEAANGDFAEAARFAKLQEPFLGDAAVPTGLLREFLDLHRRLREVLDVEIEAAIADYDKGEFDSAIAKCESVLAAHPRDPWARYELWLSKRAKLRAGGTGGGLSWAEVAKEIYSMDSLYPIAATATNEREGFELWCRKALGGIKPGPDKASFEKNIIDMAGLAMDLGVNSYAAEAWWLVQGFFEEESYANEPVLDFLLYSIDRSGAKKVADQLGAMYKRTREEYTEVAEARNRARFEGNPLYGSFGEASE